MSAILIKPSGMLHSKKLDIGYQGKGTSKIISSNLNLRLDRGKMVCLLGPNGAGKSTLIRTLSGIQKPLAGTRYIDNCDVATINKSQLCQKVSLVLTDQISTGNLSVYSLLTLARYPYLNWFGTLTKMDHELITNVADEVGIEGLLNKNMHELSDGEHQKIMIARALVQDTALIIMDEPTAHLDIPSRVEVMSLLRKLIRKTGKSVLLSTHELDLALQVADVVWLMMPGQPLVSGVVEDLILNGSFEQAFQRKGVDFCSETGTFKMLVPSNNKQISLDATGVYHYWTQRALEREGYSLNANSKVRLVVAGKAWVLTIGGQTFEFSTIQSMLIHLNNYFQ